MGHLWTEEEMIEGQERAIRALLTPYDMTLHKDGFQYQLIRENGQPHNALCSLAKAAALVMVECPPIGDRYGAPDDAPPPDEVCSSPEAVVLGQYDSMQREIEGYLLEAAQLPQPVHELVNFALQPGTGSDVRRAARAALAELAHMRRKPDPEIPF